jgi:hypothetical protein
MRRGTPPMAAGARAWALIPIAERLRPDLLDVGEVRGAHRRDEDLRSAHLAGQPINDHRRRVAGVINEQLVAAHVGLVHRDRELGFPDPVQLAEAGVAGALGLRSTYSSQRIDSVMCLRLSSRWMLAQSGST